MRRRSLSHTHSHLSLSRSWRGEVGRLSPPANTSGLYFAASRRFIMDLGTKRVAQLRIIVQLALLLSSSCGTSGEGEQRLCAPPGFTSAGAERGHGAEPQGCSNKSGAPCFGLISLGEKLGFFSLDAVIFPCFSFFFALLIKMWRKVVWCGTFALLGYASVLDLEKQRSEV